MFQHGVGRFYGDNPARMNQGVDVLHLNVMFGVDRCKMAGLSKLACFTASDFCTGMKITSLLL